MVSYLNFKKNISISPQALDQRFGEETVTFFKNIFMSLLKKQILGKTKFVNSHGFRNIFLMDSTKIKLPIKCKDKYKGAQLQSTMKINLLLELLNFSKYIYKHLSIDSLILKDLGYFNFEDFKEIEDRNIFFISRLRAGTNFFSLNPSPSYSKNGKIIEKTKYIITNAAKLGADLEVNQIREYSFFIGNEKMPVKIVLTKLPEEVVDKRTKVIQERERRNKKPSPIAREFLNISG
ncbi:MAG: hypothetical protein ACRC6E_06640, partial [Fusobacteriaceae bacterium]